MMIGLKNYRDHYRGKCKEKCLINDKEKCAHKGKVNDPA